MKKTLVVLAAGMGSRYGGLKQLDPVGPSGETIIEYSLYDAVNAGFDEIVFIIRESFYEEFRKAIGSAVESKAAVHYVFQKMNNLPSGFTPPGDRSKPWGTGHALYCATDYISHPFLIINGDDFYGARAFQTAAAALDRCVLQKKIGGMVGYKLQNTLSENGSVSRGICSVDSDSNLKEVRETHQIERKPGKGAIASDTGPLQPESITSMNLWYFSTEVFPYVNTYFSEFLRNSGNEEKAEFYLPSIANNLISKENHNIEVRLTDEKWFGVTYREDKKAVCEALSAMVGKGIYPENLWRVK